MTLAGRAKYGASAVALQMFMIMTLGNFSNASYSPLSVFIKPDFGLTTFQVGLITSAIFLGAFTVFTFSGILVDKMGAGFSIKLSFSLIALGSLIALFATSYIELIAAYYTIGFGYGAITPATNSAVMEEYYPNHSTSMGIKQSGVPVGAALSALLLPAIAFRFSLRYAFLAMVIVSITVILITGRSRRKTSSSGIRASEQILSMFRVIRKERALVAISITATVLSWGQQALLTYYTLFMISDGFKRYIAIIFLFLVFAGAFTGRIVWMRLGPKLFGRDRVMALALISLLSGFLIILFSYISISVLIAAPIAFLLGTVTVAWNSTYVTVISELAPQEKIGQYSGASLIFLTLGTIFGTPLLGFVHDYTGSYHIMWIVLGSALLISSLMFGTVVRKIYRNARKTDGVSE